MSRLQPQHMTPLDDAPATAAAAAMAIAGRLDALRPPTGREYLRSEARVEQADAMAWLRSAPPGARRYFRDRQGRLELAGIGIAAAEALGMHADWTQHDAPGASGTASAWFVAMPFDRARARDAGADCGVCDHGHHPAHRRPADINGSVSARR